MQEAVWKKTTMHSHGQKYATIGSGKEHCSVWTVQGQLQGYKMSQFD